MNKEHSQKNEKEKSVCVKRIQVLDELRGLAVLCMIFYHGFYFAHFMFGLDLGLKLFNFFTPAQPFFAGIFIVVSGISSRLSRSNLKRGIKLLIISLGVTFVSAVILPKLFDIGGAQIYFGILHFLSCSMLIWAVISKPASKINPLIGMIICVFLYLFFDSIGRGYIGFDRIITTRLPFIWYTEDTLAFLGIHSPSFFSADYFPLLPHLFLFMFGAFFGGAIKKNALPSCFYKSHIPPLAFLGRYALFAYILHIPVIYIILRLFLIFI